MSNPIPEVATPLVGDHVLRRCSRRSPTMRLDVPGAPDENLVTVSSDPIRTDTEAHHRTWLSSLPQTAHSHPHTTPMASRAATAAVPAGAGHPALSWGRAIRQGIRSESGLNADFWPFAASAQPKNRVLTRVRGREMRHREKQQMPHSPASQWAPRRDGHGRTGASWELCPPGDIPRRVDPLAKIHRAGGRRPPFPAGRSGGSSGRAHPRASREALDHA